MSFSTCCVCAGVSVCTLLVVRIVGGAGSEGGVGSCVCVSGWDWDRWDKCDWTEDAEDAELWRGIAATGLLPSALSPESVRNAP